MSDAPSAVGTPEHAAFGASLLARSSQLCVPELFSRDFSGALYRTESRNGVRVVAVAGRDLDESSLKSIMTFRLAQYVAIGFVDVAHIMELGLQYEAPAAN